MTEHKTELKEKLTDSERAFLIKMLGEYRIGLGALTSKQILLNGEIKSLMLTVRCKGCTIRLETDKENGRWI